MQIMIDYDGTFTEDPTGWQCFIEMMQRRGHKFFLVTSRGKDTPVEHEEWFNSHSVPTIYCDYIAKRAVCEKLRVKIDVWIDNDPYHIDHGFVGIPEDWIHKWRAIRES